MAAKKTTTKPQTTRKTSAKISSASPAEELCKNVRSDLKSEAITLANAMYAMQEKIEQQIPKYQKMELAQKVKVGTGETILRQNPAMQEFRATVKDFSAVVNGMQAILSESKEPTQLSDMDSIRKQFKIKVAK